MYLFFIIYISVSPTSSIQDQGCIILGTAQMYKKTQLVPPDLSLLGERNTREGCVRETPGNHSGKEPENKSLQVLQHWNNWILSLGCLSGNALEIVYKTR